MYCISRIYIKYYYLNEKMSSNEKARLGCKHTHLGEAPVLYFKELV